MAVFFDPAWEYWVADPEIAEAMGVPSPASFDGLPHERGRDGHGPATGFRFGGDPRWLNVDFTRQEALRPHDFKADRRSLRACETCDRPFAPNRPGRVVCSVRCLPGNPRRRVLPDRHCVQCDSNFRTRHTRQKFCSRPCYGAAVSAATRGKPRRLDWDRIGLLYQLGWGLTAIARDVGASTRTSVKNVLVRLSLFRPKPPGRARVLLDRVCPHPSCGVTFRPPQTLGNRYCSARCERSTRAGRFRTIDPARVMDLRAKGFSLKAIARLIGCSDVGVARVVRACVPGEQRASEPFASLAIR